MFFKLVNNSQCHYKSSAQLCDQELVEQLQLFLKFLFQFMHQQVYFYFVVRYCITSIHYNMWEMLCNWLVDDNDTCFDHKYCSHPCALLHLNVAMFHYCCWCIAVWLINGLVVSYSKFVCVCLIYSYSLQYVTNILGHHYSRTAVFCKQWLDSNTRLFTVCIVQTDVCNFLLLTSAVTQIHTIWLTGWELVLCDCVEAGEWPHTVSSKTVVEIS